MDRIEGQREVEFVQGFTRPTPFTVITRLLGNPGQRRGDAVGMGGQADRLPSGTRRAR